MRAYDALCILGRHGCGGEMGRQRVPAFDADRDEQLKEMEWFINAAKPFAGMEINVLSEGRCGTHDYELKVLAKAFEEITGIKVNHQELGEGEVVQTVQTQMQTNHNLYDAYVNDFDLIGTHSRLQSAAT